jgi:hypothetical protein
MVVLTQTALKRLLTHTSLNLKILSGNDTSSSTTTSSGPNSSQNSLNLAHLSQKNYIQELQKEKVFASLGILILNFSQVLSSIKNGKKRRKQITNDGETEGTEERKEENENENENEDEDGGDENGEEGEGEGEVNEGNEDDPCDLLPTVDLIISILAHVVASEVSRELITSSDIFLDLALPCLTLPCLALPCLALPCLALPCLALPCLALPCLALPSLIFYYLV